MKRNECWALSAPGLLARLLLNFARSPVLWHLPASLFSPAALLSSTAELDRDLALISACGIGHPRPDDSRIALDGRAASGAHPLLSLACHWYSCRSATVLARPQHGRPCRLNDHFVCGRSIPRDRVRYSSICRIVAMILAIVVGMRIYRPQQGKSLHRTLSIFLIKAAPVRLVSPHIIASLWATRYRIHCIC